MGEGSRAVRNKVSEKLTRVRGGGPGWGPPGCFREEREQWQKGWAGLGWARGQALTRPLSHPPQPPQTPDMEAALGLFGLVAGSNSPNPEGVACISSPVLGEGPAAQTLHGAKNKEQEGMTDRPAPRPPAAACLTGPPRFPWLGQREQILAPSGVPERPGDPLWLGRGLRCCSQGPPRTLYLANFRLYPAQAAARPRPILVYLLFIFIRDGVSGIGILGCLEFAM